MPALARAWLAVAMVAASAAPLRAQPEVARGEEESRQPAREPSREEATPIDQLPAPEEASGMEVEPEEPSALWWIPRALLYIPRAAIEIIDAPIRGSLYALDRYQIVERAEDLLFNDARTFGVYPIGSYDTGFGVSGGAKLVHRDMFGAGESLRLEALYGGRFNQEYQLRLSTGDRYAGLVAGLEAAVQRRPKERFFGIGNGDLTDVSEVTPPIDPLTDDTAVATRYRQDSVGVGVGVDFDLGAGIFTAARSELERFEFGRSDRLGGDAALEDVYDPDAVLGFTETVDSSYSELEIRYDTRRPGNLFAASSVPSRGVLAAVRVGYDVELDSDRPGFFRYEIDLQAYADLYEGTRALGFRLFAVQSDADVDEIAFVHLPKLGGDTLLRGYETDRFRDRGLLLGSADYKFELNPKYISGFLFVDVGRVQDSILDPSFDDLRVGFGGGVQLHSLTSFLLRAHIASSNDGGLFLNLAFDPVNEARVRE